MTCLDDIRKISTFNNAHYCKQLDSKLPMRKIPSSQPPSPRYTALGGNESMSSRTLYLRLHDF